MVLEIPPEYILPGIIAAYILIGTILGRAYAKFMYSSAKDSNNNMPPIWIIPFWPLFIACGIVAVIVITASKIVDGINKLLLWGCNDDKE